MAKATLLQFELGTQFYQGCASTPLQKNKDFIKLGILLKSIGQSAEYTGLMNLIKGMTIDLASEKDGNVLFDDSSKTGFKHTKENYKKLMTQIDDFKQSRCVEFEPIVSNDKSLQLFTPFIVGPREPDGR